MYVTIKGLVAPPKGQFLAMVAGLQVLAEMYGMEVVSYRLRMEQQSYGKFGILYTHSFEVRGDAELAWLMTKQLGRVLKAVSLHTSETQTDPTLTPGLFADERVHP